MNVHVRAFQAKELAGNRNLITMKIDPSTERGARLLGYRMRIKWLRQGWDVPFSVAVTVASHTQGNTAFRNIFGPKLEFEKARHVSPEVARELEDAIYAEAEAWL